MTVTAVPVQPTGWRPWALAPGHRLAAHDRDGWRPWARAPGHRLAAHDRDPPRSRRLVWPRGKRTRDSPRSPYLSLRVPRSSGDSEPGAGSESE